MRDDAAARQSVTKQIDYLAERCGQAPSLCRIIELPIELDRFDWRSNQTTFQHDAWHANRIVDGGVDSQA
jgi:hypothetical protein